MFLSHAPRFNLRDGSFDLVRFMSGPLISRVVFRPPCRGPRQKLLVVNVSGLISNNYTGVLASLVSCSLSVLLINLIRHAQLSCWTGG